MFMKINPQLYNMQDKVVVIYNNQNGNKGGNISFGLNVVDEFYKIEIMYGVGANMLNCRIIYTDRINLTTGPIPLEAFWRDSTTANGHFSSWYNITPTSLNYSFAMRYYFYNSTSKPTIDNINNIYIYKIVGYKY